MHILEKGYQTKMGTNTLKTDKKIMHRKMSLKVDKARPTVSIIRTENKRRLHPQTDYQVVLDIILMGKSYQ